MKCEWCGKENDGKIELIIAGLGRFKTCADCLTHYAAQEYDKIKLKQNTKSRKIARRISQERKMGFGAK